mgnify:CR=1 FL=1
MKQKKVLVHGSIESLKEFLQSPFNAEYYALALVSEDFEGIDIDSQNGGGQWEFLTPSKLNKFAYELIDGIVLTDEQNRYTALNYFINDGVEPRKIILWNNQGVPEFFNARQKDGTEIVFMEGLQFHIRSQEDSDFLNRIRGYLFSQKQFYAIPPSQYKTLIERQYRRPINWENPKTFTEKIQWMKLYDSTPIKTRLADKYLVRQWVAEKIGAEYLIPLLGVWDNFDDIDFDLLPEQFVLKCNHGSAMNIIVRDKKTFNIENAREKINAWLAIDFGAFLCELHYNNIKKKIIAEKFLTDGKNLDLTDYKFMCFNGKPEYCLFYSDRSTDCRLDYFDMDWKLTNFESSEHRNSDHPEKILQPENFELMKKLAAELCKDFAHVRVDFYEVEGKVYFGEMTFTPAAGLVTFKPAGTNEYLGSLLTLPAPTEFKQLSR